MGQNYWQSIGSLELGLHPRTFEEMHAEKMYLLAELQNQDHRALWLFRQLYALEEEMHYHQHVEHRHENLYPRYDGFRDENTKMKVKINGIPGDGANHQAGKRAVKQRENLRDFHHRKRLWLHQQIESIVNAERDILMRLGDVHLEIQYRDRWCRIEGQEAERQFGLAYTPLQQPQWPQDSSYNSWIYPDMYPCQPGLHPGSSAVFLKPGEESHVELNPLAARHGGSPEEQESWRDDLWQTKSWTESSGKYAHSSAPDEHIR